MGFFFVLKSVILLLISKIFDTKHFKKKDKKIYYNINLGKYKNLNIIDNTYRGFRYKTTKPINESINSFLVSVKTQNNPNLNINYFINQKKKFNKIGT